MVAVCIGLQGIPAQKGEVDNKTRPNPRIHLFLKPAGNRKISELPKGVLWVYKSHLRWAPCCTVDELRGSFASHNPF